LLKHLYSKVNGIELAVAKVCSGWGGCQRFSLLTEAFALNHLFKIGLKNPIDNFSSTGIVNAFFSWQIKSFNSESASEKRYKVQGGCFY
jgi:hypothetical protein